MMQVLAWVPVALFVTGHVVSIASVKGRSMSPTFNPADTLESLYPSSLPTSDIVLLNRLVTATRRYKKGDIVTLYSPSDPNLMITKRILALGGDTVRLWVPRGVDFAPEPLAGEHDGITSLAYTNIYHHALRALATETDDHASGAWLTITIPANHAWVEGDASQKPR
ncbi:uncharacterized protein MJAP1_003968 [Malassezia japonica]|uniref:Mitochondrial inner membrane protease subunit 2 n=1 Tax=Malassezia japonica TaxID=223818 RepID=A0AAF0JBL5_9BASI|nr:uncharacterized protein MJAP1_003968 [Malassezia japonica]WFD40977.1 hypothetical protein MJAP1_003968 [Malassezia japonica]